MKFRPSNFSNVELDHNTSPDPFQHALPNQKTTFRTRTETVNDNNKDEKMQMPTFAYKGTDKGVA